MGNKYGLWADPEAFLGRPIQDEKEEASIQPTITFSYMGARSIGFEIFIIKKHSLFKLN